MFLYCLLGIFIFAHFYKFHNWSCEGETLNPKKQKARDSQSWAFLFPTHNADLRIRTYMNFNIGDWIVKALELVQTHKSVRVFCYWILFVIALFAMGPIIASIAKLIEVLK